MTITLIVFFASASSWAAKPGRITGSLVHKTTGLPVIGAPIQLDHEIFAISDEDGRFHFNNVPAGTHHIRINDPECQLFEKTIQVEPNQTSHLNFALDKRGKQDEVEVLIQSNKLEEEATDRVLEMEEVKKIPGTQGDVLKIVQSLPGVARNLAFGGSGGAGVVVRGAAPEDSLVLIDDHPVPLLYHFGGLKSILNSDMLKRIDFLPGGFGVEFGEATGGIIDVQTLPCTHQGYDGYVELSMLDAGFFLQGSLGEDAGFVAAARRSTLELWLPAVLEGVESFELTLAPVYYDYQTKVDYSPTPNDRLSILVFGSSDEMKWLFEKPPGSDPSIRGAFGFQVHFHRLNLRWTHANQTNNWQFTWSLAGGYDMLHGYGGPFLMDTSIPNVATRADLNWQPSKKLQLKTGLVGGPTWFDLKYSMIRPPKEGTIPGRFTTRELIQGQENWLAWSGAVYTNLNYTPTNRILISTGLRLAGYRFGSYGDWALMPRFLLKADLIAGSVLKLGAGLYYQAPSEDELSSGFGNPDLEMERAIHYTLGLKQTLPFDSSFELTLFHKSLDKLVVNDSQTQYANKGIGRITGLELLLRRNFSQGFFGWLAYTLMRSERKDGPHMPWRLFDFDQTHILTLVAGYKLPRGERQPYHGLQSGWEFGIRFQLVSGNPDTPILGGIYDADNDNYLPIPGPINSQRLPVYHRLDIRVDYTWAFVTWALSVFLDIQNVYNYQSIEGVQHNYDFTEQAYVKGLPILPALGIRASF